MKKVRDYQDFLLDILEYTEKGARIVADMDFETFQSKEDKMLRASDLSEFFTPKELEEFDNLEF